MKLQLGAAGLLQNDKSQFLVAKRPAGKFMEGYWEFPGGKIEEGEVPESALQRELYEEIDVRVDLLEMRPFYFISWTYPEKHVLIPIFHILKWNGVPIGKEGQEIHWASVQEMEDINFLPANKPIIEKIKTTFFRAL